MFAIFLVWFNFNNFQAIWNKNVLRIFWASKRRLGPFISPCIRFLTFCSPCVCFSVRISVSSLRVSVCSLRVSAFFSLCVRSSTLWPSLPLPWRSDEQAVFDFSFQGFLTSFSVFPFVNWQQSFPNSRSLFSLSSRFQRPKAEFERRRGENRKSLRIIYVWEGTYGMSADVPRIGLSAEQEKREGEMREE